MRKISQQASKAFEAGEEYKNGNTQVIGGALAGWNTNTTRERLNALNGVRVTTKKGQAYLNGEKWDGEWITIKR